MFMLCYVYSGNTSYFSNGQSAVLVTQVAYLGHIISADGVAMDKSKVQAVHTWPLPRSVKALRGFLGLAGYYRKFIKNFGAIAEPLTRLLKKESLSWTNDSTTAFQALQVALSTAPVLQLPDFRADFIVECDASGTGIGAVLHQGSGPISFFSRAMAPRHQYLAAYERELMGLVQVVRHWRPYLWGDRFVVHTDHYSLKFLLDQRLSTIPQHHWVSKLFGYDFSVEFKPGCMNTVADALSRRDSEEPASLALACAISAPHFASSGTRRQPLALIWLNFMNRSQVVASVIHGALLMALSSIRIEYTYQHLHLCCLLSST
jgi:hypothetical protein